MRYSINIPIIGWYNTALSVKSKRYTRFFATHRWIRTTV